MQASHCSAARTIGQIDHSRDCNFTVFNLGFHDLFTRRSRLRIAQKLVT